MDADAEYLEQLISEGCVPHVMGTVVKIRQQFEGHARQVLLTAVGANHDWSKRRLLIDATMPFDRREQYERKRVPGAETLKLSDYFGRD